MPPARRAKRSCSTIGGYLLAGSTKPKKDSSKVARGYDDDARRRQLVLDLQRLQTGSTTSASHPISSHELQQVVQVVESTDGQGTKARRTEPNQAAINNNAAWKALLPSLISNSLYYYASASARQIKSVPGVLRGRCSGLCEAWTSWKLTALYFGHFHGVEIHFCECETLPDVLLKAGLFPSAPSQPRLAFSIELLDFHRMMFDRSGKPVSAFAGSVNALYIKRGFSFVDIEGRRLRDPFRRSLSDAARWLSAVHVTLENQMDDILDKADQLCVGLLPSSQAPLKECSRLLRNLCPACFGLDKFGRSFAEGTDIHVSTDGNFQHKHVATGGRGLPAYDPRQIIPKAFVDSVGDRIDTARKSSQFKRPSSLKAPSTIVDQCEASHEAAKGENKREHAHGCRYDSVGWMVLTCRHDVPLALADIDTPGERQKYAIALLLWLFNQLPQDATVTLLYDIGCVLHRSLQLHDILPVAVVVRLQIAVSVMHAYGHHWVCQLIYNPRFLEGLGLTDGENGERGWSCMRALVIIVRTCSLALRAELTSQQITFMASRILRRLGEWVSRRFRNVEAQGSQAREILDKCPLPVDQLREQWRHQKETQVSLSTTASYSHPQSLKNDIDAILSLQTQMEGVEKVIRTTKSTYAAIPEVSKALVEELSASYANMVKTSETLYVSLNLRRHLPGLVGVDREFAQTLLLARDLKENIRKRVIERLFELDRLDQAAGGRDPPLGTKLHQSIHRSIKRRQPALKNAIDKYNQYCTTLRRLNRPSFGLPLPSPLSSHLTDLREDPELLQDVWTTPSSGEPPRWLACPQVRSGIRAMLKVDRCVEENRRLELETLNMIRWYTRELNAVNTALVDHHNTPMGFRLNEHRAHLVDLKAQWVYSLKDLYQFESRICAAEAESTRLNGNRA